MSGKIILQSIKKRFIKYAWFFILFPVLTGVVSYLLESKQPTVYTANEQVVLGHYENKEQEHYTNPEFATERITSLQFLQKVKQENKLEKSTSWIQSHIAVGAQSQNIVLISISSADREVAQSVVAAVAKAFVQESMQKYDKKLNIVKNKVEHLKASEASPENVYEKEKFLYDLQLELLNMEKPSVIEPITITRNVAQPYNRALLGVLIGGIISLFILLVPEVLRDHR